MLEEYIQTMALAICYLLDATEGANNESTDSRCYRALASDSLDKGWNTEKVVKAFVARLERDRMYLKQREAQGKTGDYDKLLQNDMRAMALAAVLLAE